MYIMTCFTEECRNNNNTIINSKILSEAGVTAGAAAHATELRKNQANGVKCILSVAILGGSVSLW